MYHETDVSLLLKRTPQNAALIARYETTHYLPHRFSDDELRKLANYPQALPRLLRELGDHLAFRRDARASALLVELLSRETVLAPDQRAAIVADARRYNADLIR